MKISAELAPDIADAARALEKAATHENNGLIGAIQSLADNLGNSLENYSGQEFAHRWLLHTLANEILKYSIEDDRISIEGERKELATQLIALVSSRNWISKDVYSLLESYRKIATRKSFPVVGAEVSSPADENADSALFKGWIAKERSDHFQVSRKHVPFVSILEDSLCNPRYSEGVCNAFIQNLEQLKSECGINWICFVEKSAGPVGAIGMVSSIVSRLGMPACIFRAGYWSSNTKLVGCRPSSNDKVAIVYDLFVTGDGIKQVATEAWQLFNIPIVAAVVLYAYDSRKSIMTQDGRTVVVRSISRDASLSKEIHELMEGKTEQTAHIKLLENGRNDFSPAEGRGSFLSKNRRASMKRSTESDFSWKPRLVMYRHKTAVKFPTVAEIEKAIDLLWEDGELIGMPHAFADGMTLIVPAESTDLLRSKGLKFEEIKVISSGDLPADEARKLRHEQGTH